MTRPEQDWAMPVTNLPPNLPPADPTRADPVGRNKKERAHLATLDGYLAHLTTVIENPATREGARGYSRARRAALVWALTRIADAERGETP